MEMRFMKGNEAIAEAAVRAGCRFFAGYPITPQNEIPEYMSRRLPEVDGTFVQGESEVASINMIFGAAATGTRAMTSSSSPGISLKSEGISYLAGAELPAVIVNVMRGGPGLGQITPAQTDYLQATKAAGHGGFKMIVLAPSTIQEAVDLTYKAFDYAERDKNPVMIASDGCIGAMMEPVVLPEFKEPPAYNFAGRAKFNPNYKSVSSSENFEAAQEVFNKKLADMYEDWNKNDALFEEYMTEDAEYIIASYGISARVSKTAIKTLRKEGIKIGLVRPITLSPFPYEAYAKLDSSKVKRIIDVEMAIPAQMIDDVKIAVEGRIPVSSYGRTGGNIITDDNIIDGVMNIIGKEGGK
ncbi:2-oxoglutarate ferredoxin oxidoreductase subunit alpha [Dethiosulfatibacter aminovorans DSM 17477]|uniref:2-oxoglutarate ferredoxin oxidoreductase subunit alpha n=1 Tax=Dethiosulfatibacter aminovorans DSM 17477 TaxID=1121476 RepID=A0A1M6EJK9_9FIRM|nr:3-methyl-2-oxobutanoate dehydrogenase subunit VorB [Dethiosulfatibacter aminovorans]SHI85458.1 2-oxoglutarate ferredoxin oxidoreductase subunit alpha [Dethiosulfatibacter aminovorans DSM 17477]